MTGARRVLYTSVFGGFERVWPPIDRTPGLSRFVITDSLATPRGWTQGKSGLAKGDSPRLSNRHQKMLFQESLPQQATSLYVDANVRAVANLAPLFEAFEESGADLGMYPHYARASVHSEVRACIARNKVDNPENAEEELLFYDEQGFPDTGGMWEGSVIFKNNASPHLSEAMQQWWSLYSRFETRDQFSLPYIIWKHGLVVLNLDDQPFGRKHYFVRLQHSSSGVANRSARYLQAKAPENPVWASLHKLLSTLLRRAQERKKL